MIIWDKLFGTFKAEEENDTVIYGLTTPLNSNNIFLVDITEVGLELESGALGRTMGVIHLDQVRCLGNHFI